MRCQRGIWSLVFFLLSATTLLHAQHPDTTFRARNSIYGEFLGQGFLYSLNYEYSSSPGLAFRAGISTWGMDLSFFSDDPVTITCIPLSVSFLSGTEDSHAEFGLGVTTAVIATHAGSDFFGLTTKSNSAVIIIPTGTIGYRYQPYEGGTVFRIGFSPFLAGNIIPYGYISLGFAF